MKNWDSKELLKFSTWLWEERQFTYSMLVFHGFCWGLKIGTQLNLKWSDIIYENGKPKSILKIEDEVDREISENCQIMNAIYFNYLKPKTNDLMYINRKTNKIIETSNLSKNLQRFSNEYVIDVYMEDKNEMFYPMKGSTFQLAWVIDMLKEYNNTRKAFIDIGKFLGKNSIKEMINFVGFEPIEPNDNIEMKFDILERLGVRVSEYETEYLNGLKLIRTAFQIEFEDK
jgi:hypothetical protein